MIVYDLECRSGGHRFEGWFRSSEDFADQQRRALLMCPSCGSADVDKAVQAPRLGRKGNQLADNAPGTGRAVAAQAPSPDVPSVATPPLPPQAIEMMRQLAVMQAEALKTSRFVGETFADEARAMHYGERETESIHGQTTIGEAKELLEEGIAVMPLPFPVLPPDQAN